MKDKSFHDYIVHDLLGDARGISSRAMFGGWGLYKDGVIFGIIVEGELYFKVDDTNRPAFEQMESHPFVYTRKDRKPVTMSYWLVPEDALEDQARLADLIEQSVTISQEGKLKSLDEARAIKSGKRKPGRAVMAERKTLKALTRGANVRREVRALLRADRKLLKRLAK